MDFMQLPLLVDSLRFCLLRSRIVFLVIHSHPAYPYHNQISQQDKRSNSHCYLLKFS